MELDVVVMSRRFKFVKTRSKFSRNYPIMSCVNIKNVIFSFYWQVGRTSSQITEKKFN